MTSTADVVRDIADYGELMSKRGGSTDIAAHLVASLCARIAGIKHFGASQALALCNALDASSMPRSAIAEIQEAVDARTRSTIDPAECGKHVSNTTSQHMRHMYNFLTAGDYAILDDPRSAIQTVVGRIVFRLRRLGVKQPSHDGMLKWAMVIVVHAEWTAKGIWPSYTSIYNTFLDLNGTMKSGKPLYPHGFLEHYPETPDKLDQRVYDYAYDADDPPVSRYIERYEMMGRHIPLRSNSKLLAQEARAASSAPVGSNIVTWDQLQQHMNGGVASIHDIDAANQGGRAGSPPPSPFPGMAMRRFPGGSPPTLRDARDGVRQFQPRLRTIGCQLQIEDKSAAGMRAPPDQPASSAPHTSPPTEAVDGDGTQSTRAHSRPALAGPCPAEDALPADIVPYAGCSAAATPQAPPQLKDGETAPASPTARVSTETYEDAMFQALQNRNKKRDTAAKERTALAKQAQKAEAATAKADAATAAPPQTTSKDKHPWWLDQPYTVHRRLSNKRSRCDLFVPPLINMEPGDETRNRNCFTSKHYLRAQQAAKAAGFSVEDVHRLRKDAYARAAALWNKRE